MADEESAVAAIRYGASPRGILFEKLPNEKKTPLAIICR
jgi:hypothetical protein